MATPRVHLVLASASPARRATLRAVGIEPTVIVSEVDEDAAVAEATDRHGSLDPADVALLLARAKCEAVAADLTTSALVIGCDSILELDGEAHSKPRDAVEATERWRRMRGRAGTLHTGHWLRDERAADEGGTTATLGVTASTTVHFAHLSDAEIDAYVATGEPLRVAGAFTVDGLGGAFVEAIEGDHHNVVGLSLPLLRELLAEVGVSWFDLATPHGK
jgi:septum formation protein